MTENKITAREDCLLKAIGKAIGKDNENYGEPEDNLQNIADLWNAFLTNRFASKMNLFIRLTPAEVAQMMALFKIGRIQGKHSIEDSYIDACSYLACGYECQFGGEKNEI